jgi:hypothetical protein
MTEKQLTWLMEWNSGTPPRGHYMLDTGSARYPVDVEDDRLKWDGKIYPIEFAYEFGKLLGPIPRKETENMNEINGVEKKRGRPVKVEATETASQSKPVFPPGIDAEVDAKIRAALAELAKRSYGRSRVELAARMVDLYGCEIKTARESNRCWRKIAGVFRQHGLDIGYRLLKNKAEGPR